MQQINAPNFSATSSDVKMSGNGAECSGQRLLKITVLTLG